jgi:SAM-dependent methyltransferase
VLVARGEIGRGDLVLDVGCGTGSDCLTLARWGFKHVVGMDPDAGAVRVARGRATRLKLGRRARFLVGGPEDLPHDLTPGRIDVVLHTLVANNLRSRSAAHYAALARAMKPDGLLVVSARTYWDEENGRPGLVRPFRGMSRHFELTRSVTTHRAESADYYPGHAPVAVWFGRPRRSRSR